MNKKEIIKILKKYNFDNKKYIVISGASMVLQGVKNNTNDIDIAVTKDYYDYLLKYFKCSFDKINIYGHKVYFIDNIINFGIDYFTLPIYVEGIPVQSLDDVLKLKKNLNRNKDIKDIELLNSKPN